MIVDAAGRITLVNSSMASALDVCVTAEGVETPAQLVRLRAKGCEFGQGYLFSRPASAEAVGRLLSENRDADRVAV